MSDKKPTNKKEKEKIVRMDLMFSQAIEVDILGEFDKYGVGAHYTKSQDIIGTGYHDPKMGDAIWPQLNSLFTIFCTEEDSLIISRIIKDLRVRFPMEGIACFRSPAEVL